MKCRNCDGGEVQIFKKNYYTKEMAMDAGLPELEGYPMHYFVWETCPCCGGDWMNCKNCEETS